MALFSRKSSTAVIDAPAAATVATPDSQVLADISGAYTLDPTHSRVGFSARHAMVTKVRGQFDEFEGSAVIDTAVPTNSKVDVTIKAASVTTGQEQRDAHLMTPDFFDVENHENITFTSTDVVRDGAEWSITGDLTINAVTRPVTVVFEETGSAKDPYGNVRVGFEGSTTINRADWGLAFNAALETGGVLVSERIALEFDISAIAA